MQQRRVYIAYTGGTIGMATGAGGYEPAPGLLEREMAAIAELRHPSMPSFTVHEYQPLLDSANMLPQDWFSIARDIRLRYDDYDGFVVLHGTDTMAYTASALAFMLENLAKPVVLTGSQIPLCEVRNDARENLITALMVAAQEPAVAEVSLLFGHLLLRGCRSMKLSADGLAAFGSPNFPPLGRAGVSIEVDWPLVRKPGKPAPLAVRQIRHAEVASLRLFPGISSKLVRRVLEPPLEGLILEAYGVGNAPVRDRALIEAITEATGRGVVIVDCTQCIEGTVDLRGYATGSILADAGVISGYDMTAEAALAKLYYLLSCGTEIDEVKSEITRDLRGELTLPHAN
jgi:L-asparaginase